MAKGSGNPAGRRPSSRNAKPYDANNSFVKKMATKVTDFIPQSSWISKWFNTSQDNTSESRENIRSASSFVAHDLAQDMNVPLDTEETVLEDDLQQPPSKRSRIRMDVIHPPGTFSIQSRVKTALNTVNTSKEQYSANDEVTENILEPATAGPSGIGRLISSIPVVQANIRTVTSHRSDLNSLPSSTNNGISNGMDDNSESSESTSGCSSLIPQINRQEGPSNLLYSSPFPNRKRHIDDKLTFTNHLQSSRSLFLDCNSRDTLSSHRPSFNASVVTNVLDRTSPLSSPFYSGNTTFGGANAAGLYKRGRNIFNNSSELQLKIPRRANVEVTASDATGVDSSGMSQTAKKILEALEHFSSPITDAKKIPLKNTNNTVSLVMNRKRVREEIANPSARVGLRHLTRELTVPTVPDILKLRRRQKLQDTTLAARKIVSARSDPPPPTQEYRLRTEDNDNEKFRGKLKGKSKINLEQEETVVPVNLPNIPLPITTLPNFNFTLPSVPHTSNKTVANKENTFIFASPIRVTDAGKSYQSVNNFTFSNPINAEDSTNNMIDSSSPVIAKNTESTESSVDCVITSMPNFIWSDSSTAPRLRAKIRNSKDDFVEPVVACELKPGSVMDILCPKSNKAESNAKIEQSNSELAFQTTKKIVDTSVSPDLDVKNASDAESSWECSECLFRNSNTNKQCTACKIARQNPNDKISSPSTSTTNTVVESKPVANDCFGSQFKLSTNQWECSTCCVRNKQNDTKCVACSALKPGSNSTTQQTIKSQNFDLMEKFKFAEGSWECSGCLLRNYANVITCPCCDASKPISTKANPKKTETITESTAQKLSLAGTKNTEVQEISFSNSEIMNKFKPSKDTWECSGCLVRNNNSVTTCPCCSTAKPGSVGEQSKAVGGIQSTSVMPNAMSTAPTFTFGIPKSEFTQPVSNKEAQISFGTTTTESSKPATTIINSTPISTIATLPSLLTQQNNTSNTKPTPIFTFGVPSSISTTNSSTFTNSTTTCLPTFAQPTFTFSDSKIASQPATIPTFGQVPTSSTTLSMNLPFAGGKIDETSTPPSKKPANDTPTTPLFPVVSSSSTSLFTNNESKTTIAFSTDKPSAFTATNSKPSGFSIPENKIPTFSSSTENKPSIFGTPETKLSVFNPLVQTPPPNSLPTFGASSSSATPQLFGSSNTSAFGSNTAPAFGGTATTPAMFSSTKPSETNTASNSSLFTFGSTSSQSAGGGFNFSANANPAASSAKPLFTFSSNSNTPQNNSNLFGTGTFGANSAPTDNTVNFTFNAPKPETPAAFSQGAVATPMFGTTQTNPQTQATSSFSSTPSSSTGFNFGSTAPPAATPGSFNFGGMSSTSTSTGGFNFNSTSAPAVAFDPNSRPSFNFTRGSAPTTFKSFIQPFKSEDISKQFDPEFSATPQSAPAPRKYKKAFRRCMR